MAENIEQYRPRFASERPETSSPVRLSGLPLAAVRCFRPRVCTDGKPWV